MPLYLEVCYLHLRDLLTNLGNENSDIELENNKINTD